ncbi:MAG: peptide chain release factor N(5)-glutamine methyltransferase [Patescibacteria group bacterium]
MTIKEILNNSLLPRPEAEMLLAFLLGLERPTVLTHPEIELTAAQYRHYEKLVKKRLAGQPIAYLTGEKEFYGLKFLVNRSVLVPRPETEMIVDSILADLKNRPRPLEVVDLGTGSGAIVISLAVEMKKSWPQLAASSHFLGTDISTAALKVARQNAKNNGSTVDFRRHDLWTGIKVSKTNKADKNGQTNKTANRLDLVITANLPYLTPAQIKRSPSIHFEPTLALDGGRDGLKYYRRLFKQLKRSFPVAERSDLAARKISLYCEIDPTQTIDLKRLADHLLPRAELQIDRDLKNNNRLARISWAN